MDDRLLPVDAAGLSIGPPQTQTAPTLVIGEGDHATMARAAASGGPVFVAPFSDLDAALLARLCPEWVVFPLMAPGFDAPVIIEMLVELGYSGRACVVAPRLPNRRMVEVELRSIAPSLHLVLVETPE